MCTKRNRFTFNAIMLALLSLILFGCGGGGTSAPAQRTVNGVVSDSSGGQPFANAAVTAYAIDAAGNVSTTPLSATVQSDGQGNFSLKIPKSYTGAIELVATETTGSGSTATTDTFRSVMPSVSQGQVTVISPATDMVYQYLVANNRSFTSENIQKATLVLEPFLGPNFTQIPPPTPGSSPTPAQQQLIVMTQAINSLVQPGTTIANLLTVNPATGIIALGEGANLTALNAALSATNPAIITLINQGTIPGSYTPPPVTPVAEPTVLSDTTAPSAPQNLVAAVTTSSVSLSWNAAPVADGVTAYYVYRNGVFYAAVATPSFTDTAVQSATAYTYEVKARDAAGNLSAASTVIATTSTIPTFAISGKVTLGGVGLPSVFMTVSGTGTGVVITDAGGNYTITGVRAGNYTITPILGGYAFTPESRAVNITTASVTGMDFTAAVVAPGTITGEVTYPDGTVVVTTTYPDGTVTITTTYPNGTVAVTTTYPNGTVTVTTTYPNGTVTTSLTYPNGTVAISTTYPDGTVTTTTTYPSGTVTTSTTYPSGTVTTSTTYSNGAVTTATTYPDGTVTISITYSDGTVATSTTFSDSTVTGSTTYPSGTVGVVLDYSLVP